MFAVTSQSNLSGQPVPAGYLGVLATLWKYNSSGYSYVCNERPWTYNADNPTSSLQTGTQQFCGAGTYYSRGTTKTWQGSYYLSVYTYPTSNLTAS